MAQSLELDAYKQGVADFYDRRSQGYDEGEWRVQVCHRLLAYSPVSIGESVLDIGTGTGCVAIASAKTVGTQGHVTGVDISPRMLKQAHRKVTALGLNNVTFQLADAETLDDPAHQFDHVLCANTFPWMKNKAATLRLWHRFLKPGGRIAVHTPADTAYVGAVVLRRVLARHGLALEASNRMGSIDQCRTLFENAGFEAVELKTEQHGSFTTLDKARATWESVVVNPSVTSPQVANDGLSTLSQPQLARIKAEFATELETLQTEQGVWDDLTTLYILGRKPVYTEIASS
ncbi:Aklanonic acid methyltransferase DauC [Acaryochloris thomasi RCC1774]|uniref:Aklanonic acid methyltransferase DauC n=1 Tax=Acaryochloris thomasi RCC1774 TaxID=1764569 RepID=A0A2W1JMB6_9CYAN|nr:class I SAM-dependent methyltransferase [Acaryochloris thomasi]PZD70421.1 Aklanonic acid methyltransferase DauC [Acaryochloris thomasi RCC1774]